MMFGFLLRNTIQFPAFLVKQVVSRFTPKRKWKHGLFMSLPIAGLDRYLSLTIANTLNEASINTDIIKAWMTATQLAQIVYDRLLRDLNEIHANLIYWQSSMQSRHHAWLMFIQRGPFIAFERLAHFFQSNASQVSATELIKERVVMLSNLEKALSKALTSVYDAAVLLRMEKKNSEAGISDASSFQKRAYYHVRHSLTKISDALRTLQVESTLAECRGQRNNSQTIYAQNTFERLVSFECKRDHITDGDTEDVSFINELIAHISNQIKIDTHRPSSQPVYDVFDRTQELSYNAEPLVVVSKMAQRPSRIQRHWIQYMIYFLVSGSVLRFLFIHSPLAGSSDMQKWVLGAKFAIDAHVLQPLRNLAEEVFDTFHGSPGIVSKEDYELSKDSLLRMLKDFKSDNKDGIKDHSPPSSAEGEDEAYSLIEGMDTLMRTYETQLKSPLANMIVGQLSRALLIQVQKLKVDTESAMLQLDQILRANELNVALIAAIPSLLIAVGLVYFVSNAINRAGPDPMQSLIPCKLALVELQRALAYAIETRDEQKYSYGNVMYRLQLTYSACLNVFKNRDNTSQRSEWPSLKRDFIDLARPLELEQKLKICERMRVTYSVF